jgi:hypothetical protein
MHENKLTSLRVRAGGLSRARLVSAIAGWPDENGWGLRYQSYYSNGYPPPPRVNRRRGQGQGQGRIDA